MEKAITKEQFIADYIYRNIRKYGYLAYGMEYLDALYDITVKAEKAWKRYCKKHKITEQ